MSEPTWTEIDSATGEELTMRCCEECGYPEDPRRPHLQPATDADRSRRAIIRVDGRIHSIRGWASARTAPAPTIPTIPASTTPRPGRE